MTTIKRGVSTLLAVLLPLAFALSSGCSVKGDPDLDPRTSMRGSSTDANRGIQVVAQQAESDALIAANFWVGLPYTNSLTGQDVRTPTLTPSVVSKEAQLVDELVATDPLAPYIDMPQLFDALIAMTHPFASPTVSWNA